ncbi:hypothetical protein [Mucilaginibacter ginsenosidivorax]|uniref:Nuclear transport factor 2 family protein n=1 Tax=Mucilaginibacter ginsenosidivorax TaxID=862126 RepID=A0A5B8W1R1_9SPHI|nr:hypothetical protein [Mucilaginibacter ginsenosidivorax]QEC76885.1 hypothetical protein FSB76_13370 [Mucilaginibacter ginsenosidivorax]
MLNSRFKATRLIVLIVFAGAIGSNLSAQTKTPATTAKPEAAAKTPTAAGIIAPTTLIEKFFRSYDKESTTKAMIDIFKTNPLIDSNSLVKLISKIDTTRSIIGAYTGKDLIVQRRASNSLILYSYLVKHQNQPLRFTFMFYKPKNEWVIYRLYFDDSVSSELEQSAKITAKP